MLEKNPGENPCRSYKTRWSTRHHRDRSQFESHVRTDRRSRAQLSGVRPMIKTYPLDRTSEAYARTLSGKAESRVVLTMQVEDRG
jgi:hypothetical protein